MKTITLNLISNWYKMRADEIMEVICINILLIREKADQGIIPHKKTRMKLISEFTKAVIYLNKSAKYNEMINLKRSIEIRDEISEFIYN